MPSIFPTRFSELCTATRLFTALFLNQAKSEASWETPNPCVDFYCWRNAPCILKKCTRNYFHFDFFFFFSFWNVSLIVIPFLFLLFVADIFLSIIMYLQDLLLSNFCFFFSLQSRNTTEIHQITVSWAELCSCLHIFRGCVFSRFSLY